MKRILILTPFFSPNIGGAETFTDELIKEILKCHYTVTVLTFQPFKMRLPKLVIKERLLIYRMKWWLKQSNAWKGISLRNVLSVIPQMVFGSISLCLKNKYDIIHAQGLLSGFVAVLLKKIFKKKVFITLLALYEFRKWYGFKYEILKFIMDHTDVLFVEGENGLRDIASTPICSPLNMFRPKIIKFNHWVDQDLFKPPEARPIDKVRVLFVGRPIPEKGRHIIEEASKILDDTNFEFHYVENVTQQELAVYYKMAHIVVVPSLYAEGYSRVVAESASCGCALVVSNRGSLPEMCKNFAVIRNPTPKDFVNGILVCNPGNNYPYNYAKKNFSSKNAEVFLEAYDAI